VPAEFADKYRGQFDEGWDALRERTLVRQRQLGVVPPDAELTERPDEIPAWADMPDELKPVLARQMELYAGFLEHTDFHVGRVIDALEDLRILDDTLIYYIVGDNGASAEGTVNGTFNELLTLNGAAALETADFMASRIDKFGTPEAYNHYAVGWAHAMDTPYQWTKQVASHWGGTRNGTIVHWPAGILSKGEIRSQFHHVIDIAATVLDIAGLPEPTSVHGVQQMPLHGVSMRYSFDDAEAAERRETQYFEMFVNRGIYHKGWTAVTRHSTPWMMTAGLPAYDDDVWELYAPEDWTQSNDLAAEMPDRLHELQRLFLIEAVKYDVLPLDDRRVERFNADIAGRPQLVHGNSQLLFGGMRRLSENSIIVIKNKSHSVTAEVVVPDEGAQGVIVAQGGSFGGWSLYVADGGRPAYCYKPVRAPALQGHGRGAAPTGRAPAPNGVRLRRRRAREGRRRDAVPRREGGRRGPRGRDRADAVLGRRDHRPRRRQRHAGERRLRDARRRVQRRGPLGADRHRRVRRGRRPHDRPRRAPSHRDGAPVGPSDRQKGNVMAIGPVQLIVLGFNHPEFHGEIIAELERLRESDAVRVIDSLAVYKDAEGEVEVEHLSNLTEDEARELGSKVGALVGLGIEGDAGLEAGAVAGAEAAAEDGLEVFSEEEAWDVVGEIPNDSAAALLLIEHHWAVPLRDAIARANGFRIGDGFISPLDLVEIGLMSADEARGSTPWKPPQEVSHDGNP